MSDTSDEDQVEVLDNPARVTSDERWETSPMIPLLPILVRDILPLMQSVSVQPTSCPGAFSDRGGHLRQA
jgi:hypothetical protein